MNPILIVDDERPIAELIELTLLQAGYQCEIALDGDTAADKIEAGHYDLILLDIMLPSVSGYELMEYIAHRNAGDLSDCQRHAGGPGAGPAYGGG